MTTGIYTASFGGRVFSVNVDKILQYPPLGAYRENSRASVSGHFLKRTRLYAGTLLARDNLHSHKKIDLYQSLCQM